MPAIDHRSAAGDIVARRVRRGSSAALALAFVAALASAPGVAAGGVGIHDFEFIPPKYTAPQGSDVPWGNVGSFTHSVTSDPSETTSPKLDYWTRHDFAPGSNFAITFNAAGTFFYHCSFHSSMQGKIKIPLLVGHESTLAVVTTASVDLPSTSPFRYLIRWRMVGAATWNTIRTRKGTVFFSVPSAGDYEFVGAVQRKSNAARSGWSKVVRLTIS
jgi:plastocyanin